MTKRLFITALLLLIAASAAATSTVSGERKSFAIERTDSPPIIDGNLDDAVWREAVPVDDFLQTAPINGAEPTEVTIVRVTYDDEFLYIAAHLKDSNPEAIQAKQLIQGRTFYSDDRFWVTLDSFNNKRNDYFFQVNANGIRREALRENNARFIEEWDTIWYAESKLHADGWATEIAIPFKSISFAPNSDTWGINFGRGIVRKQEYDLWSSYERQDWPAYGGEVTGIEKIEQGLGLDVVPSVNVSQNKDLVAGQETNNLEPSLDVRYRITPSLSSTFTFNTNFATAEVDQQQVALDRFSLFYPEKRDFFLQDAGIFEFGNINTNGRPFFSRRIGLSADGDEVGIDAGIKLTGRVGDFNIGALAIRQEAYNDVAAQDLFVGRGSYNILDESAVGFIVTHGDPASNESNSVIGADFLYRNSDGPFGQILTGKFWAQQSQSDDVDDDNLAVGVNFEIPSDKLRMFVDLQHIEENFRPALGFVNRVGIRRLGTGMRYRTRPDAGVWRAINHRIDYFLTTDMEGATLSEKIAIEPIGLYTNTDDYMYLRFTRDQEVVLQDFELFGRLNVPAGDYEFDRYRAQISTGVQRPVRAVVAFEDGGYFGGTRQERTLDLQWRQSEHLFLGLAYTENVVELPSGRFTSRLASFRSDIAFNSRWAWTNFIQYDNTAKVAGINSRLRYMPEAGQQIVLVMNHGSTINDDNTYTGANSDINLNVTYTFRY